MNPFDNIPYNVLISLEEMVSEFVHGNRTVSMMLQEKAILSDIQEAIIYERMRQDGQR